MKKYIALLLTAAMLAPTAVFAENTEATAAPADTEITAEVTAAPADTEITAEVTAAPAETTEPAEEITTEETTEPAEEITTEETTEPTQAPTAVPRPTQIPVNEGLTSDTVTVDIYIGNHQVELDSSANFNLFNSNGELVATDAHWIGSDTEYIQLNFTVPTYTMGEVFTLGFVSGFHSLTYYSETIYPEQWFELATYTTTDEAGNPVPGNTFALNAEPNFERGLNFYYDNKLIDLSPRGRLVDGIGMMPAEAVGKAMGLAVKYHEEYNSLTMSLGADQLIFNIDTTYSTFFGEDMNISHAPVWIDNSVYVPIRDVLTAFDCTIELWQDADHIDVIAPMSPVIQEYRSRERVNREGITSRTNYLIWVSKSDYTVKVYEGSQYNWQCIYTAPCAIGAPGTPTIEGQFEYQYAGGRWDYGSYYVWPTMMFYGGYALHSTLRGTWGGMYDDRVGVMISHGCVRMHPADIDWIYATIPLKTRIYVTP